MILVTGGLGYLGSHIALYLMSKGHEVVLVDNLSQASMETLERLEYSTKMYVPFVRLDVRNTPVLQKVFEQYPIDYVIHTAGFKNMAESNMRALDYYNNNLSCMMSVLRAMQRSGVKRLVNLSSIAVYGQSGKSFSETSPFAQTLNIPYVRSQQMIEHIIKDTYNSDNYWQIINLRLGNVIGAYGDGRLGEWMNLMPKSVLPMLLQTAAKQREVFEIYHDSLDTNDGSAERAYIHIMDVVDALYRLMLWSNNQSNFLEHFNINGDKLVSLQELITLVEDVTGSSINVSPFAEPAAEFTSLAANCDKIKKLLEWKPKLTVEKAIQDQWQYYQKQY